MLKSSLCYFSNEYMLVMGRITITRGPENTNDANEWRHKRNKGVILKNVVPFTDCISKTSNT